MKPFVKKIALLALTLSAASGLWAKEPAVGSAAPAFTLADVDGKKQSLADYKGKYVVLEWINHGCPFVKKHYDSNNMQTLQKETTGKGAVWLSVCSSAKGEETIQKFLKNIVKVPAKYS
jgi:peroxiredoxin